jgi:hypothetical protein
MSQQNDITNKALHTIDAALQDIAAHAGQDGFRQTFDQALHIVVALQNAGLKIVRKPVYNAPSLPVRTVPAKRKR